MIKEEQDALEKMIDKRAEGIQKEIETAIVEAKKRDPKITLNDVVTAVLSLRIATIEASLIMYKNKTK